MIKNTNYIPGHTEIITMLQLQQIVTYTWRLASYPD